MDLDLLERVGTILGTTRATETVNRALEEVVRQDALRSLISRDFEDLTLEALQKMRTPEHVVDFE